MNLAPEILKMRDALLERVKGKSLKEVAEIVNEILLNETSNINRLAALSARVQVLRDFTKKEFNLNKNVNSFKKDDNKENIEEKKVEQNLPLEKNTTENNNEAENWVRVEMIKSGIVNGVRFPEGVVIDVSEKDANKLVKDGLVKIVENVNNENEKKENISTSDISEKEDTSKTSNPLKDEIEDEKKSVNKDELTQQNNIETAAKKEIQAEPKEEAVETTPKEEVQAEPKEEAVETTPKEEVQAEPKEEAVETTPKEEKKILKKKSTKITEETIELTDPKAVAEALGLNEKKKKNEEPVEIEEELDIENLETGK